MPLVVVATLYVYADPLFAMFFPGEEHGGPRTIELADEGKQLIALPETQPEEPVVPPEPEPEPVPEPAPPLETLLEEVAEVPAASEAASGAAPEAPAAEAPSAPSGRSSDGWGALQMRARRLGGRLMHEPAVLAVPMIAISLVATFFGVRRAW